MSPYTAFLDRKAQLGGPEVYGAVMAGRRGIGVELKASYYRQAIRNVEAATRGGIHAHQSEMEGIGA